MKIMMFEDLNSNILFLVPAKGEPDALDLLRGFRPDGDFSYRGESSEFSENDGKGPIAVITDDSRIRLPGNNLHLDMMHHHFRQSPQAALVALGVFLFRAVDFFPQKRDNKTIKNETNFYKRTTRSR